MKVINPYRGSTIDPDPFIITVNSGASGTFTLPFINVGTYNVDIDWGDGNIDTGIVTYNDARLAHSYSSTNTDYTISIYGPSIGGINFNNTGDKLKLQSIDQWGTMTWATFLGAFNGCSNMVGTFTDAPDLSSVSSMASAFSNCTNFNSSLNTWDVSNVTTMLDLFYNCTNFNGNISSWDVSSVANFYRTFGNCTNFNIDISSWDTSSATTMNRMFNGASSFDQNIGSWNVSLVSDMLRMFLNATSFDQDLGAWDIQSLTDATLMFTSVTLSTANYDSLLVGWEANVHNNGVTFSGGNSKYTIGSAAETARTTLIGTDSWSITDGGGI